MFRWVIRWMSGQKVSRCASDDPSACMLMAVLVRMGLDSSGVEGGEPMMMMLRCSGWVVILAIEVVFRRDLR